MKISIICLLLLSFSAYSAETSTDCTSINNSRQVVTKSTSEQSPKNVSKSAVRK